LQPPLELNLRTVRQRIVDAATRAGRGAADVHLVAVTKSVSCAAASALVRLGAIDLGESRAGDLEAKCESLARAGQTARWHFIGHLQRNKARRVVERADFIHSVDSIELLCGIDRIAGELHRRPHIFLQVKMHPEPSKSGFDPSALAGALAAARLLEHIQLRGLMAMAPLEGATESARTDAARNAFEGLRDLARASDPRAFHDGRAELSMGMSGDFEVAIAAGSDWVRIGGALFEGVRIDEHGVRAIDGASEARAPATPRAVRARKPEGSG
jgi:pyridoxal phosphate enzyme (YggS family)